MFLNCSEAERSTESLSGDTAGDKTISGGTDSGYSTVQPRVLQSCGEAVILEETSVAMTESLAELAQQIKFTPGIHHKLPYQVNIF